MGKNDPQNKLECKFVHPNQNLCAIDPLTPHNATPDYSNMMWKTTNCPPCVDD